MSDRKVHAVLSDGSEVVHYDRSGKWYHEPQTGPRKALSLDDAAELASPANAHWYQGRSGGLRFDVAMRTARHEQAPPGGSSSAFDEGLIEAAIEALLPVICLNPRLYPEYRSTARRQALAVLGATADKVRQRNRQAVARELRKVFGVTNRAASYLLRKDEARIDV